jgi:hypothetical protein
MYAKNGGTFGTFSSSMSGLLVALGAVGRMTFSLRPTSKYSAQKGKKISKYSSQHIERVVVHSLMNRASHLQERIDFNTEIDTTKHDLILSGCPKHFTDSFIKSGRILPQTKYPTAQ